jgi:hypothetical protein
MPQRSEKKCIFENIFVVLLKNHGNRIIPTADNCSFSGGWCGGDKKGLFGKSADLSYCNRIIRQLIDGFLILYRQRKILCGE